MKNQNEIEKDYWKITDMKKLIEIEKSKNENATITEDFIKSKETQVRLMEEAQEFGIQSNQKDVLKILDESKWKLKDVNNKEVEEALHYSGNEVFMDMHNEDIDESKEKIDKLKRIEQNAKTKI